MSKMLLLDVHSERERDLALMPNSTSISIRATDFAYKEKSRAEVLKTLLEKLMYMHLLKKATLHNVENISCMCTVGDG